MTVIATGPLVHRSLEAADQAAEEGISVEVVDPRTLQPLDEEGLVESVKKTNRAVVAHEAVTRMGFGAEVAAVLQEQAFDWLDAPIERVGAKFAPLRSRRAMEQFVVPQPDDVLAAIRKTVGPLMATDVKLPRLGQGMESGTIVKWLKARGRPGREGRAAVRARHRQGDPGGRGRGERGAAEDRRPAGEVPVGQTVAVIGEAGESRPEPAEAECARPAPRGRCRGAGARARAASPAGEAPQPAEVAASGDGSGAPGATAASRRRRSRAGSRASAGSSSRAVTGTGPDGRIVAEDVERAAGRRARGARPPPAVAAGEPEVDPAHEHPQDDRAAARPRPGRCRSSSSPSRST